MNILWNACAAHPMLADSAGDLVEHVLPHYLGRDPSAPGPAFGWSNHIIVMLAAAGLMLVLMSMVGARARTHLVPTGIHNFFESILSFLRTELIRPALLENTDRFTPFIWTVFFFILFCNVLGMIPVNEILELCGVAGHREFPTIWGSATANFSVTLALAIMTFVTVHVVGIVHQIRIKMNPSLDPHHGHGHDHGAHSVVAAQPLPVALVTGTGSYIWNFAPHPEIGWKVMDLAVWVMLLVLEGIGALVKPTSLCVRLFANMLAGHLVPAALIGMIPFAAHWLTSSSISVMVIAGCTGLGLLDLFVAFLQAYIFAFLTTLYLSTAIAPEH